MTGGRDLVGRAEQMLGSMLTEPPGSVVVTSSGLTALELALEARGVGPGSRVACDALYPFAALAIANCGATAVAFDLDPDRIGPPPEALRACVDDGASAIVLTSYFGVRQSIALAGAALVGGGVDIVEDRAQSFGPHVDPWPATYSFQTGKLLSCGQGGAVAVTDGDDRSVRQLVNLGWWPRVDGEAWTSGWQERVVGRSARLAPACAQVLLDRAPTVAADLLELGAWTGRLCAEVAAADDHAVVQDGSGSRLVAVTARSEAEGDRLAAALCGAGFVARRPHHPPVTSWPGLGAVWDRTPDLDGTHDLLRRLVLVVGPEASAEAA